MDYCCFDKAGNISYWFLDYGKSESLLSYGLAVTPQPIHQLICNQIFPFGINRADFIEILDYGMRGIINCKLVGWYSSTLIASLYIL